MNYKNERIDWTKPNLDYKQRSDHKRLVDDLVEAMTVNKLDEHIKRDKFIKLAHDYAVEYYHSGPMPSKGTKQQRALGLEPAT